MNKTRCADPPWGCGKVGGWNYACLRDGELDPHCLACHRRLCDPKAAPK